MSGLLPVPFLWQLRLCEDVFCLKDLQLDIDVYFPLLALVLHVDYESVSYSRFQELQEADCTLDIDVLDSEGAHLQEIVFEIIVCDSIFMGFYILEQLLSQFFGVLEGEFWDKKGEVECSQFDDIVYGGIAVDDLIELVDLVVEGGVQADEVEQVCVFVAAGRVDCVEYQGDGHLSYIIECQCIINLNR